MKIDDHILYNLNALHDAYLEDEIKTTAELYEKQRELLNGLPPEDTQKFIDDAAIKLFADLMSKDLGDGEDISLIAKQAFFEAGILAAERSNRPAPKVNVYETV